MDGQDHKGMDVTKTVQLNLMNKRKRNGTFVDIITVLSVCYWVYSASFY